MPTDYSSIDIPFVIPQTHRIRTTEDVLGPDAAVLLDVLQPSGALPAKVQVWVDSHLLDCRPELPQQIQSVLASRPEQVQMAGSVQSVVGGEPCKNDPALIEGMLEHFNRHDLDRRSYIVVIGGGAVLDAVGYAAAIAHRGIRLVRLPTTTLAQADSGVGVKNAVNWFGKKNWKGTFAVPWAVINDWKLLETLPDRDFRCGFSEAVKVTLLKSREAFDRLCENAPRIAARDEVASAKAIASAVRMHIRHITEGGDPFEMLEARPLDFGHWSAHRMEPLTDYTLRHGEAVSIGVAIDTMYSARMHGFPASDARRVLDCLTDLGLPVSHPLLDDPEQLRLGLEEFRQHLGGRLTITLLEAIGKPIDVHEVDWPEMQAAIEAVRAYQLEKPPR
ncbi:3-dehydroquinate synthase [Roseimaritima sediminicola]|uniref:3-dehydroquinate synthase n=1 Tax=Roseimaritima sediminicola TaxID=2662066 RepID=UPI0012985558|nr:3-dehydroquinate synthase [Roseimaritima sediminicola]